MGAPAGAVVIPDVLAMSASPEVRRIWSSLTNAVIERRLWVRVMIEQRSLGLDIPWAAIESSREVLLQGEAAVDLESIKRRERITRHDVKARLEEFCDLAGHEYHHLGMTSADVVDNVMLIRMRRSLEHLGMERLAGRIPFRGVKGPVGTQQDQVNLLGEAGAVELDRRVAQTWGFRQVLNSVGQVYPRSIDFEYASGVEAKLRDSHESPLLYVLSGFTAMIAACAADQWNEGDVSHSSTRRYAIPGVAYVASILLECGGQLWDG